MSNLHAAGLHPAQPHDRRLTPDPQQLGLDLPWPTVTDDMPDVDDLQRVLEGLEAL